MAYCSDVNSPKIYALAQRPGGMPRTCIHIPSSRAMQHLLNLIGLWILAIFLSAVAFATFLETSKHTHPLDYSDCDRIEFEAPTFVRCACLDGLWGLQVPSKDGLSELTILKINNTCLYLNAWISSAVQISSSISTPVLKSLDDGAGIIVIDNENWEVELSDGQTYCLEGAANEDHYCHHGNMGQPIKSSRAGCSAESKEERLVECDAKVHYKIHTKKFGKSECELVPAPPAPTTLRARRVKRDDEDDDEGENTNSIGADFDEDAWRPEDLKRLKGHKKFKAAVRSYVLEGIEQKLSDADVAAAHPGRKHPVARVRPRPASPAQHLLELCMYISQRLCTPVDPYTFEIAVRTFLKVQTHDYHLREPYIGYGQYQRSVEALERCRMEASAFMFVNNDSTCATTLPTKSSDTILHGGIMRKLKPLPDFAIAKPGVYDPVVETVWKAVLLTQNFCFPYFNDYYNDHHSFTYAMVPFFTNVIQGVWLVGSKKRGARLFKATRAPQANKPPPPPPAAVPPPDAPPAEAPPGEAPAPSPAQAGAEAAAEVPPPMADAPVVEPGEPYNYTTEDIWYGNLLGRVGELFMNLDHCYEAAKLGPAPYNPSNLYPWFMRRPNRDFERDWHRRKKRAIESSIQTTCKI